MAILLEFRLVHSSCSSMLCSVLFPVSDKIWGRKKSTGFRQDFQKRRDARPRARPGQHQDNTRTTQGQTLGHVLPPLCWFGGFELRTSDVFNTKLIFRVSETFPSRFSLVNSERSQKDALRRKQNLRWIREPQTHEFLDLLNSCPKIYTKFT